MATMTTKKKKKTTTTPKTEARLHSLAVARIRASWTTPD